MISHEHKCIFIHLPKVGGATIEHELTGYSWHLTKVNGLKAQHEPAISLNSVSPQGAEKRHHAR